MVTLTWAVFVVDELGPSDALLMPPTVDVELRKGSTVPLKCCFLFTGSGEIQAVSFAVGGYRVTACGWGGSIPPCLAGPETDVLPVVLLLADVEEGLFLPGRKPSHLLGPVFSELWTSDSPTPHLQLHSTGGGLMSAAWCWDRLLTDRPPAMATRHCWRGSQTSLALLSRSC